MSGLDGNVALITGGARGIGEAIAVQLAAGGARVMVGELVQERAEAVAERLGNDGITARACDVRR